MDIDNMMKIRGYNNSCNNNRIAVLLFLGGLLLCSIHSSVGDDLNNRKETEMEAPESKVSMIIDAVKTMFYLSTSPGNWAFKAKDLYQRGRDYFVQSPNIDFRSGSDSGAEGAAEKVKEAVVKSLDESKATVVGSAKSAAKFTDSAVDKTMKKLKKTLSGGKGKDETEL